MNSSKAPIPEKGFNITYFLTVRNQKKSSDYYSKYFNASVIKKENPCILQLANTWLILNEGGGPTPDKPGIILKAIEDKKRVNSFLNFVVPDIQSAYKKLKEKGIQFMTEPMDNHGSDLRCFFRDPDGYLLELSEISNKLTKLFQLDLKFEHEYEIVHHQTISDFEKSKHFYGDILGGEVLYPKKPLVVKLANNYMTFNIGGGPTPEKPDVTLETPQNPNLVNRFINIRVADIEYYYKDWKENGAHFITEPLDNHKVEMRCYIKDPDGYLIEVGETSNRTINQILEETGLGKIEYEDLEEFVF